MASFRHARLVSQLGLYRWDSSLQIAGERAGKASECISTNDQFARGKERSYPAFLESKIIKLRAKLAEVEKTHGARNPGPTSLSTPPPASYTTTGKAPSIGRRDAAPSKKKENSEIDDLVSNFGVL